MKYWLVKSEPAVWSWAMHAKAKKSDWDGVRNHQAAANLRAMAVGDHVLFYHSTGGKEVVGVLCVDGPAKPDPKDPTGKFVTVPMRAVRALAKPVSLAAIKAEPRLADLPMLKQPRLSVMPLAEAQWRVILELAGE